MFHIFESTRTQRRTVKDGFASLADAMAYARDVMRADYLEEDAEYPGEAADFIARGLVFSIEPVGFKLKENRT